MEPKKSIINAIRFRDKIIETFKKDGIVPETDSEGQDIWYKKQESKKDIDKVKGYASFDLTIDPSMEGNFIDYYRRVLEKERPEMDKIDLHAGYHKGISVDDPDMEIIRFVIELNPGDYNSIGLSVSEKERKAMLERKSNMELRKDDDLEEESRMNSIRPGRHL